MDANPRVDAVATDIIQAITDTMARHDVTHSEYRAAWMWLMQLAGSGEVPLFLDVFFESAVERLTYDDLPGSKGAVQGPYHSDAARPLSRPYVLPMREGEPGEPILFTGRVLDLDEVPVAGARVDVWHSANDGTYSGFSGDPDCPPDNLRGVLTTDDDGRFAFRSIRPAPYQIPHDGPTGEFLAMLGRHSWRPAHFHLTIDAPGHDSLTTQLYFEGDPWLEEGDCVDAVKDELVIGLGKGEDPDAMAAYGIGSAPYLTAEYTWRLRPAR